MSVPSGGKRTKQILELVHSDVFGPVKVPSLGKSVYYVSIIDDFLRNAWIYFQSFPFAESTTSFTVLGSSSVIDKAKFE